MHEQSGDDLATALLRASRVMVGVAARSLQAESEGGSAGEREAVTLTQFRTLVALDARDGLNQVGLAAHLGVDASTAQRMVDKLVKADLVARSRHPENRREVALGLTRAGKALVDRVVDRRRRELGAIAARMPGELREAFLVALESFSEAAGEPEPARRASALGEL